MTPSPYIPITPATRIPFPCWLWRPANNRWDKAFGTFSLEEYLEMGRTHYCTSDTEPTGRPGEDGKWTAVRQEHESLKAIVDQERNPKAVRPLGPDEAWPNSPAVPTASGATGEALNAARQILAVLHSRGHVLRHHSYGTAPVMTEEEMAQIILWHILASRPAVAQEGVRDTERLDWLEDHGHEIHVCCWHHTKEGKENEWTIHKGDFDDDNLIGGAKLLRDAIDASMSSQSEGLG